MRASQVSSTTIVLNLAKGTEGGSLANQKFPQNKVGPKQSNGFPCTADLTIKVAEH